MSANADQDFVVMVVKAIVNHPEDVSVDRRVDEMGVLLTLKINPADMGYVIGRQGQTARAIRTLLKIVGAKNNARVNLKIHDPNARQGMGGQQQSSSHYGGIDTSVVDDLKI